jgi:phosphate transport system protein
MGKLALALVKDVIDAYVERDADKALDVWRRDEELDEMYSSLFREFLTYMMEDPRNIGALHASPVHGQEHRADRRPRHQHRRAALLPRARQALTEMRPKGDKSSLEVLALPTGPEPDRGAR